MIKGDRTVNSSFVLLSEVIMSRITVRTPQGDEYLIDMSEVSHAEYVPPDDDEIDGIVEVLVYFTGKATPLTLKGKDAEDFWRRSAPFLL